MNSRLFLNLLLGTSTAIACAISCPLSAQAGYTPPTAKERQTRNFQGSNELVPEVTKFNRRLDYREEEKLQKERALEARKQAQENARKAELAAAANVKKREQTAVDANNRGVALGQQRRWLEAISAHEQAIQMDPQNKQFRINLSAARTAYAQEKLAAGDLNSAATLFRKALAAASDNGLAGKLLVETMRKQKLDPNNVDTRLDIGDQLSAAGDLESAKVEFQAAMQLENSARTFLKMGDMALRYGQASTASNWYRQAIVKDPNYGPAHRQLGLLAVAQNDYTAAASSLRKALVLDSKDTAAGQTLVDIWRRQVAQNPLLAENHLGLAGALQLTGDFMGAETEYKKVEALDPRNIGLSAGRASLARAIQHAEAEKHKAAAETLYGQGLHREALIEIGRAVQMEPKNARYQFLLAECLESVGEYQQAHQAYLTCVLMDPERNKEAAARMREMQRGLAGRVNLGQQAQQIASQLTQGQPAQQQVAQQQIAAHQQQMQTPQAQQVQQMQAQQTATPVDQAAAAAAAAQQAQQAMQNELLTRTSALEAAQDYNGAIAILRQALPTNLKNAELHHRLAVNLLAAGQITEAISEFRLSSALRPDNQAYAADLARAMAIHKRSISGVASTMETAQ